MADTIPLPKARKLFLPKQVTQESMNTLTKGIIEINANDELLVKLYSVYGLTYKPEPIQIFIDSYGGAVYQCFGLLGVMESSKVPIHTIVTGAAMSCGFMILIHGDKRFAYRHATPLYHQVSTGFWGTVKDMEEKLEESKRLQSKIEEMTLDRTKITRKKLKKIKDRKVDWYMSAEESLELGVVDKII